VSGEFLLYKATNRIIGYLGRESTVSIPSTIRILGSGCFRSNTSISTLIFQFPSSLTRIESNAFLSSSLKSLCIPASVESIDGSAFGGCHLDSLSIDSSNSHFVVYDQFVLTFSRTGLIFYFGSDQHLVIPNSIESLCESCFEFNDTICDIEFDSNSKLRSIESRVFTNSKIRSLFLPASITWIHRCAFDNSFIDCLKIDEANDHFCYRDQFLLDKSERWIIRYLGHKRHVVISRNIAVIARSSFRDNSDIGLITFEEGSSLERIGKRAFADSSVQRIVLPPTIRFIGSYAFPADCTVIISNSSVVGGFKEWKIRYMQDQSTEYNRTHVKISA
jgi:hypothetical protein